MDILWHTMQVSRQYRAALATSHGAFACAACVSGSVLRLAILLSSFQSQNVFLIQKCHPYSGNLNSEKSGDSKNAFPHYGDVWVVKHPLRGYWWLHASKWLGIWVSCQRVCLVALMQALPWLLACKMCRRRGALLMPFWQQAPQLSCTLCTCRLVLPAWYWDQILVRGAESTIVTMQTQESARHISHVCTKACRTAFLLLQISAVTVGRPMLVLAMPPVKIPSRRQLWIANL